VAIRVQDDVELMKDKMEKNTKLLGFFEINKKDEYKGKFKY
jgi:hypothetical protein